VKPGATKLLMRLQKTKKHLKIITDICKVVAEHIRIWLEPTDRSQNRVNGIILGKKWAFKVAIPEV